VSEIAFYFIFSVVVYLIKTVQKFGFRLFLYKLKL